LDPKIVTSNNSKAFTFCHVCEQFCGLEVTSSAGIVTDIKPDKLNPYSWRDFCIKGATSHHALTHPMRLKEIMKRSGDRYVAVPYAEAVAEIADSLNALVACHGPHAVAEYSGNPLGFSFYHGAFRSAFMDAIGSRNRFWVGSIDHNAYHVVALQMYGSEWPALQLDVDNCDCIFLLGSNPAISGMNWCGQTPDGWRRVLARVAGGGELIIADPRLTESAKKATLHLPLLAGGDWALLLGMLVTIFEQGWEDHSACDDASGVDRLRAVCSKASKDLLAEQSGLHWSAIVDAANRFALARTAACIARTGPAQSVNGTVTEWLSQVLNLVTGRTDVPGGRFFNAYPINMIEALSKMRPTKDTPSRVRGLKPVVGAYSLAELPDEIKTPGEGQIRALFINSGNPVITGPNGDRLSSALKKLDLLIAVDLFQRESHRDAHWLIPGTHFLERSETHPMIGAMHERPFIQRSVQAVAPPAGVVPEWKFYRDLAVALGLQLFGGRIAPDPEALVASILATTKITPQQVVDAPHGLELGPRQIGALRASLLTSDGKINAAPSAFVYELEQVLQTATSAPGHSGLRLIARRRKQMMNSWLVETTAKSMRDPDCDRILLNPDDATKANVAENDLVTVYSDTASIEARVRLDPDLRSGVALMEHGWGSGLFDPASGNLSDRRGVNRNRLVSSGSLDPLSGVPSLNGTIVNVMKIISTRAPSSISR
jgi:formate dehydrogenase